LCLRLREHQTATQNEWIFFKRKMIFTFREVSTLVPKRAIFK